MQYWIEVWKSSRDDLDCVWITILTVLDSFWYHRNQCMWSSISPNPLVVIHEVVVRRNAYRHIYYVDLESDKKVDKKVRSFTNAILDINPLEINYGLMLLQKFTMISKKWMFFAVVNSFDNVQVCLEPILNEGSQCDILTCNILNK